MSGLRRWWRVHFLAAELSVVVIGVLLLVFWAETMHGWLALDRLLGDRVDALYSTFASVYAALLGFIIATTAIVAGFSQDERMKLLRQSKHYPVLWKVFVATIRALGVALLVSLIGLVVDGGRPPIPAAVYALLAATALALARLARSMWVLERMIAIVGRKELN